MPRMPRDKLLHILFGVFIALVFIVPLGAYLFIKSGIYNVAASHPHTTLTEWITVGGISFTAEMNGHSTPAGFIVLDGTVTDGSFTGAHIHQRSNLVGVNGTTTSWTGQLQLLPASA